MHRLLRVLLPAVAVVAVAGAGVAVWLRDWSALPTFGLLAAVAFVTNWSLVHPVQERMLPPKLCVSGLGTACTRTCERLGLP